MKYEQYNLDNGITVLTDYMPNIESVTIEILVKIGSANEVEHRGISHLVEHMMFKGTSKRTSKEISQEFDKIGGYLNAYTTKERTVYYAKILKNDLNRAIDVLSDMILNSIHDPEELEKEKKVVMQEISDYKDDPTDVMFEALWKKAYPSDTIGEPIAGSHETVGAMMRDDVVGYIDNYYRPDNTVISISGNFDKEKTLKTLSEKFSAWEKSDINKEELPIPEYSNGSILNKKDIEQIHLAIGFNGLSYYDEDYYLQHIASIVAGGSTSARMYQEVREKLGLAYGIATFCSNHIKCGIWGVQASTDRESVDELLKTIMRELHKMADDVSEEEVDIAKAQIKSSLLMAQESSNRRAEKLCVDYAIFGRVIPNEEVIAKIEKVDHIAVRKYMKDAMSNHNSFVFSVVGNIDTIEPYEEIIKDSFLNAK